MFKRLLEIRGHIFYRPLLKANSQVIDLGAHCGEFSKQIARLAGCRCYAVEANPKLCSKIQSSNNVAVFNYAIGESCCPVTLYLSENPEGNSVHKLAHVREGEIEVRGITLDEFCREQNIATIDLLKVDIEGAEFALLRSLSDDFLRTIKQITMEFHDFIRELNCKKDVEKTIARLESLGFISINPTNNEHNMNVLFANRRNISFYDRVYLSLYKNMSS